MFVIPCDNEPSAKSCPISLALVSGRRVLAVNQTPCVRQDPAIEPNKAPENGDNTMKIKTKLLTSAAFMLALVSTFAQTTLPDDVVRLGDREFRFGQPANAPVWDGPLHEDGPISISGDGLTLFLESERPGGLGGSDLWMTTRPTPASVWSTLVNLGPQINSSVDDSAPRLSPDGLSLYFVRGQLGDAGSSDIWLATRPTLTDLFGTPVKLGPAINSSNFEGHTTVSADNLTLIFDSDRSGGVDGSTDLWISTRINAAAAWEPARPLDPPINTSSLEIYPCLSEDGLLLFFSSNRPPGTRLNIWVAKRSDAHAPFGPPAVIRTIVDPTGSRGRDFPSLSADGTRLYYNQYRDGHPYGGSLRQISITALPQLRGLTATGNGEVQFDLVGREGANYTVETSADLRTWTPWIMTNTIDHVRLTYSIPPDQARRFYRAITP